MKVDQFQPATGSMLIEFDKAEVIDGIVNGTHFLHVTGVVPCLNMRVDLTPMYYIRCPDYWGIQVTGTLDGICLEAVRPYSVVIPLQNIMGWKGIEVIGHGKSQKFDLPRDHKEALADSAEDLAR